jgi:hypothetical protein
LVRKPEEKAIRYSCCKRLQEKLTIRKEFVSKEMS